jgi:hypothetical protein
MGLLLGHLATRSSSTVARGAFRVFGTNSEDFKAFAGLAEAVRAAHSRDTIEVATNGPFVLEPVALGDKALTIRSASGARPVFLSQRGAAQMLTTKALLVLEGLEFRVEASETSPPPGQPGFPSLGAVVSSADAPLFVANCRFQTPSQDRPPIACAVDLLNSSYVELRNCEIRTWPGCGVMWEFNAVPAGWDATNAEVRLWVVNCVQLSETTLTVAQRAPVCAAITLQRNTISARVALDLHALVAPPGLSLFADTNVFDCPLFLKQVLRMGAGELKASLRWKESHNFFNLPLVFSGPGPGTNAPNLTELTAWNQCWNQTNTGSAHLRRRRDRPFLSSRAETLTASASEQSSWLGEQIAAAGGDRSIPYGAALELVGPGPAGEPPELHAGIAASRDDG